MATSEQFHTQVKLSEIFLASTETLDESHGQRTLDYLRTEEYKSRGLRIAGTNAAPTWDEFDQAVRKQQAEREEEEQKRLNELRLADAGLTPETSLQVLTSGSRLRRPEAATAIQMNVANPGKRKIPPLTVGGTTPPCKKTALGARLAGKSVSGASTAVPSSKASTRSGVSTREGDSRSGPVMALNPGDEMDEDLPGGVKDKELSKLLISTHGKSMPSIPMIMSGTSCARELGGVFSEKHHTCTPLQ